MSAAQNDPHAARDLIGYGSKPPHPHWPNNAKICLSFVLNVEEGGEHTLLNGDDHSEAFLTEGGATAAPRPGPDRHLGYESAYAYGSRCGFWRILDLFKRYHLHFTSWSIGRAIELNPAAARAMEEAGCEVGSHSYRWIDYNGMDPAEEKEHISKTMDIIKAASPSGQYPRGWYTGRMSMNTRKLVYETYRDKGVLDILYDSDSYEDDLPYWVPSPSPSSDPSIPSPPLLVVPYCYESNDMKYAQAPGFTNSTQFFDYLRDAFDVLYAEGERSTSSSPSSFDVPKMLTIAMHSRVLGRPGRFAGLERFVEYISKKEGVWVATREEIAAHWRKAHPPSQAVIEASRKTASVEACPAASAGQ
ncbi:hypothetical protein CF327_g6043 [Tilletia walkeri]|uniref:NodB homology domain-containing protein n=1 Tax=Tilletia walkeri TaxID=117179 RepID=A0A8X7N371_9BASI|nr:hypothetical protein CF327_g6043 [Tilletia walkeri]KAE8266122.1 hypothetical protein A4X09_0g6227 [Tilletia walkeri]